MAHPYRSKASSYTYGDDMDAGYGGYGDSSPAHLGEDTPHHQDLLSQSWNGLVNGVSSWAHKPPSWFPDWMSNWLHDASFPTFWMWCFVLLFSILGIVASFVAIKVFALIGGSLDLRAARRKKMRKMMQSRYQARRILTANETEFYGRLRKALTPRYTILSQVSMSALLEPKPQYTGREYMQLRAKFSQKYVDFVICDPDTVEVIALIELDDITHDPEKDALRDEMTEGAGYVTVRWHSRNKPSVQDIARTIDRVAEQRAWMNTQPMMMP